LQEGGLYGYLDWIRVINHQHNKLDISREIIYKRKDNLAAQAYTIKERLRIAVAEIAEDMRIASFHEVES
jgi:hypothetical protein